MRLPIILSVLAAARLAAQTASFPGALPTDSDLLVATNRAATTLSSGVDASTLTIPVTAGSAFVAPTIVTIDSEIIKICTAGASSLTACSGGRGFDGSTAATHASGATVRAQISAWYHNRMRVEVKALATALGANLANVGQGLTSTLYNFAAQAPGGTLTAAVGNTVTLTPCPLGVNGANTSHWLRISGGVGAAEAVLITGGTCTSGAASGTVIFTPANSHSGAWTVSSATAGLTEAMWSLASTGGSIYVPAGIHTLYGPVTKRPIPAWIRGAGRGATELQVATDFALTHAGVFIVSDVGLSQLLVSGGFEDFTLSFTQPDSASYAAYTAWPPAFKLSDAYKPELNNITILRAWDGVSIVTSQAFLARQLQMSFFRRGIDADNVSDSIRVQGLHAWPFGTTTNQLNVFLGTPAITTLYLGQLDNARFDDVASIAGSCADIHRGTVGTGVSLDGFIEFSNLLCDTNGNFVVNGARVQVVNSFFSTGYGLAATQAQPAIKQTGGSLQLSNATFYGSGLATGKMIHLSYERGLRTQSPVADSEWPFTLIENSYFYHEVDVEQIYTETAGGYTGTGHLKAQGNQFWKNATTTISNPVIRVTQGATGQVHATIQNNTVNDRTAGSGTFIATAGDRPHVVSGNRAKGWQFSLGQYLSESVSIATATLSGTTLTVNTSAAHNLETATSPVVHVSGITGIGGLPVVLPVATVSDSDTFTVTCTACTGTSGTGGTMRRVSTNIVFSGNTGVSSNRNNFQGPGIFGPILFGSLPAVEDGSIVACADCTPTPACAAGGTGALARRISGAWVCSDTGGIVYPLSIANGGTAGSAAPTAGGLAYGTGTAYAFTGAGTANQLLLSGGAGAPSWANIASRLTAGANIAITGTTTASIALTGLVPVANGGTNGAATPTAGGLAYGTGTAYAFTGAGTANQLLLSGGAGTPSWANIASRLTAGANIAITGTTTASIALTGIIPVANGGTGSSTSFTDGSIVFAGASGVYSQDNARLFWDRTNFRLGIGTSAPNASSTVEIVAPDATITQIFASTYGNGTGSGFVGIQSNGTRASPTATTSGQTLAKFVGAGRGTAAYGERALAVAVAAENWSGSAQGARWQFWTTPIGSTTPAVGAVIDTTGYLGLGGGGIIPNTQLDVDGAIASRQAAVALANGANQNVAIGARTLVRITGPTGGFNIGGFANGFDGRVLIVLNTTGQQLTINNEDAGSTGANRITTLTGANVVLRAGSSSATFVWDTSSSRWILAAQN